MKSRKVQSTIQCNLSVRLGLTNLTCSTSHGSKNPDFPRDSYDPFTLKNMRDAAEFKAEFRVEKKNDLHSLAEALQITGT